MYVQKKSGIIFGRNAVQCIVISYLLFHKCLQQWKWAQMLLYRDQKLGAKIYGMRTMFEYLVQAAFVAELKVMICLKNNKKTLDPICPVLYKDV